MAEVKVFGAWGSPFTHRVELALKLKGVEYEFIEEDVRNKSPQLLQYNPVYKKIPVLLHNGKPITESLVILEYIDDTWEHGPSIMPKNPYDRAMARFWAKFLDEKCVSTLWKACWIPGKEHVKDKEEAQELLQLLDNELKGKKFFGGDSFTLADIAGNFIAFWFGIIIEVVGVELMTNDKFPNLCSWIDEFNSSFKEHLPDRDKLTEVIRGRFLEASAAKS
ncbi:probable glutathione S-transferase [Primulina huaijiensis]|uniref:probable glutathione S-transferase n=1 Tax=Primulina huaijiensis TaxID=1492673 RepID=UPI003CC7220F